MNSLDVYDFDYLQGTGVQAQQEAAAAVADTSSVTTVGTQTQVVGFDASGLPVAINVAGDANGAGLSVSAGTLTATLTQDLRTTASPTFAGLTVAGVVLQPVKNNYAAAVAPTVNDDSADGYAIGSQWIDTVLDDAYICCDSSLGSAVWKKITP